MTIRIGSLHFSPLKGAKMWEEKAVEINTKVGVVNDRRFAIPRKPIATNERASKFNKMEYYCCANTAAMAVQEPDFLFGDMDHYILSADGLSHFGDRIGAKEMLALQDSRGEYHLADTDGAQVSFLNLATHRKFEDFVGKEVNPNRWRMNVWVRGLSALAELDWVDAYPGTREFMVGAIRMRADDVCVRCKAPWANPSTGEYDMDITSALNAFMDENRPGYRSKHHPKARNIMGFYGVVLDDGILAVGDQIRLL